MPILPADKGALDNNTTGNRNTAIGYLADVATGNLENATAIGTYARVASSNAIVLGAVKGVNSFPYNTNVGIGTISPDTSAMLDLTSTERGVLFPRMTQAQRTAIPKPATGLLVYQTDGAEGFYFYRSTGTPGWVALSVVEPSAIVGKSPSGSASVALAKMVQEQQVFIDRQAAELKSLRDQVEQLSKAVQTFSNHPQKQ